MQLTMTMDRRGSGGDDVVKTTQGYVICLGEELLSEAWNPPVAGTLIGPGSLPDGGPKSPAEPDVVPDGRPRSRLLRVYCPPKDCIA